MPKDYATPPDQIVAKIDQDMFDFQNSLVTNADIIKNIVKDAKSSKYDELKDETIKELKDIPHELVNAQKWNNFKVSPFETAKSVGNATINELKDVNKYLGKFGKSTIKKSSEVLSDGKNIISAKTPKISKNIDKSLKGLFKRKQSLDQKDLDLLKKLADLKQEGIISAKEFTAKKKKILAKL